jgi:pSer/pThr/pTyr-binding forkhead associated (FHA) protein
MWTLKTVASGDAAKTFRILPGAVRTLGRATGADFIVDAALVSRLHCRLTALPEGELEVRDLESTNGTFVNGNRVDVGRLASGDRLQVGRMELIALLDGDEESSAGRPGRPLHERE